MPKAHGLEEHKGKTIPKEVKSLADRIRKKQPDKSDEYAYRTAWDVFRSHTSEGKAYPHKSPESGLASEGGGTGPIHKQGAVSGKLISFENALKKWKSSLSETASKKRLPTSVLEDMERPGRRAPIPEKEAVKMTKAAFWDGFARGK